MNSAGRAYAAAASVRTPREQEADVFRRVVGALRAGRDGDMLARVKALSDCRLLWSQVAILVADPDNALPDPLKAGIISIAGAVDRDISGEAPDMHFLIEVTENMALGLSGR